MNDYYIISHTTQDGDVIYYNSKRHIFVTVYDTATWYDNKVDALLVCRKELSSYTNIKIVKVGVN